MKAAFLAVAVLAAAGVMFYFSSSVHAAKASGPKPAVHKALPATALSLPLFFEPNQGQTAPQVKFLARGAGYGLFLTADEAVLRLRPSAIPHQPSASGSERTASSVIRMKLDGANSAARVSGTEPMPGKSSYFIGNEPAKWRRNIPQFARVQYESVYPGVDLVYYGNQGQLEYDFRVAPGAEPNQIALSFDGARAHVDSGDLLLSTDQGDVRFHAPHIYQRDGSTQKSVTGSFRQLVENKIGFTIGDYDHSRELVIDPTLSYSTFLGGILPGSGTESLVKIAVDSGGLIYVAGTTDSTDFPTVPPGNSSLAGARNIFISKINPSPQTGSPELVYSAYLGSSGTDSLAGIAVDKSLSIYVAGTTTSACTTTFTIPPCFPTTPNAFQTSPTVAGTHGFLSRISLDINNAYSLAYSTYLAGNGVDHVTGLAIDGNQNAYVTGDTTSSNPASDNFPANPNGYQTASNSAASNTAPGNPQFFASKINTAFIGSQSLLYSTYFGGGNPPGPNTAAGGGIAVDPSGTFVNMYFTGTTNMLQFTGNGEPGFPLQNAQQSCLNEASNHGTCNSNNPTSVTDGFVAKINPNQVGEQSLVYSTYIGAEDNDSGVAIAVDTSANAYVTGSTASTQWTCASCTVTGFQPAHGGTPGDGNNDAFVAKIGSLVGSIYTLTYFTYIGGPGDDNGQDIKVDAIGAVHVVGSTSGNLFAIPVNPIQPNPPVSSYDGSIFGGGQQDAFVALIGTSLSGKGAGDYLTYLGGRGQDQGTGIAFDVLGTTYVAGSTQSADFPTTPATAYQAILHGPQDAFVSKIAAVSNLSITVPTTSPSPNPVNAGAPVTFTFSVANPGPDPASQVTFNVLGVPTNVTSVGATVSSGSGGCSSVVGSSTILCNIGTMAVGAVVTVTVTMTPTVPASPGEQITISGSASANGGAVGGSVPQGPVNVVDFVVTASTSTPSIRAGDTATIQAKFCPTSDLGYSGTITPTQTTSPSMVTATTPIFDPTTVTLSGTACGTTTLSIATVPRPVTTGSLFRHGSFYATWLPIGGLSLVGLGIGAGCKRRRWLAGAVLGLIAGAILLQSGCGSSSTSPTTGGGTQAGTYGITISGSAGTGSSHTFKINLVVT
jgi:hypothetical protein